MMQKIKQAFGVQDMTVGRPMDSLVRFSIPLLLGNLAQQLYNTVDSIVVGTYVGDTALAAVGTAGPILNLLIVLFMGIATGASILSAQYFGAKDREQLSRAVGSTIFLTIASGQVISAIGDLQAQVVGDHVPILGCGMYNILSGVLRGLGDSLNPLIYLVIASLMNIVLDLYFVRDLGMGVAGVAWATIMAQAVSGVLCLIRLVRMRDTVDINRHTLRLNGQLCRRLTGLGLPAGITQAIFSLSAIVVQSLTNSLGTAVIATSVAVMRVDGFAMMPNFTFGTASTTYTGQNIGAGRLDRIHTGTRDLMKLALGVAGVLVLCILFFGGQLISLFTNTPTVIEMGIRGLRWLAFGYLAFAVSQVLQGVMRGVGETMTPMWISIVCTVLLRLPIAYLWAYLTRSPAWPNGHPDSIFASLLVSWTLNMLITLACFRLGRWRKKLAPQAADKA